MHIYIYIFHVSKSQDIPGTYLNSIKLYWYYVYLYLARPGTPAPLHLSTRVSLQGEGGGRDGGGVCLRHTQNVPSVPAGCIISTWETETWGAPPSCCLHPPILSRVLYLTAFVCWNWGRPEAAFTANLDSCLGDKNYCSLLSTR